MTTTTTTTTPAPPAAKPRAEIKRFYDHKKASADLREYNADLTLELMRQPGLFAYYNALLVQAEAQFDRLKASVDVLDAKLASGYRAKAAAAGDKTTEAQVKAAVTTDSRMIDLQRLVRDARAEVGYLKGTCQAFAQRKDSLMQMAYLSRKELEGQSPQVMRQSMRENQDARMRKLNDIPVLDLDGNIVED